MPRKKKSILENTTVVSKPEASQNQGIVSPVSKPADQKITVDAFLLDEFVNTECSNEARLLFDKSRYGTLLQDGRVQLTLIEAYYLMDKGKIRLFNAKNILTKEQFLKKCLKLEKNFWVRYAVYADIRDRGYIIKTALKFGADFRVYNKGVKPGEDHAR
jgi:tRNA-intron endonuclease, archaea type